MTGEEMTKIYDRLLSISLDITAGVTPDPSYINRKIGECHIYLGEVERFFINVSKEISVIQRASNNSKARYESEKDNLLTTGVEIKSLPNITEKVARANSMLKDVLKEIQNYDNQLVELNNLLKAINHKHRNLTRANGDIKSLIKMIEAQIRLGSPTDAVAKGFMEEMRKGLDGEDAFKNAKTDSEESKTVDPTVPPDLQDLLVGESEESEETEESVREEADAEEQEEDSVNNLPEETIREAEEAIKTEPVLVDLGVALEPVGEGGVSEKNEPKTEVVVTVATAVVEAPTPRVPETESPKIINPDVKVDGLLNLDDLLKQYS